MCGFLQTDPLPHNFKPGARKCPGLGLMHGSTHFGSGAFSPLPPGPLPGESTPEQPPPLCFICISLTSGPHPTLQADILV